MPFELCNAPSTFQRVMTSIFFDLLHKSMSVFIDDFSTQTSEEDHYDMLRECFVHCRRNRLSLNPAKTYLSVQKGVLLRYVISKAGK